MVANVPFDPSVAISLIISHSMAAPVTTAQRSQVAKARVSAGVIAMASLQHRHPVTLRHPALHLVFPKTTSGRASALAILVDLTEPCGRGANSRFQLRKAAKSPMAGRNVLQQASSKVHPVAVLSLLLRSRPALPPVLFPTKSG